MGESLAFQGDTVGNIDLSGPGVCDSPFLVRGFLASVLLHALLRISGLIPDLGTGKEQEDCILEGSSCVRQVTSIPRLKCYNCLDPELKTWQWIGWDIH